MKYSLAFFIDSVIFTPGVVAGTESLGGSESACVGLARALAAKGHDVHIFATKLDPAAEGPDHAGVTWHPADTLADINAFLEWDVFVTLRMVHCFDGPPVRARLRLLWNQDLLVDGQMKLGIMARAWALDGVVYVSEFHRRQWEALLPELAPLGYVTRNGFDPAHVPTDVTKDPTRVIHISRPERGLRPLLEMWPALRAKVPDATLHLCRYSSMYDADGWGEVCKRFDAAVEEVNRSVGGIVWLGELGKADLYRAIAEAAVMWYPGVHDFGETSCIAAIEAQANGTPFVGSQKGALSETVPSGILIPGNADTPEYQEASVAAVAQLLEDGRRQARRYRDLQQAGRAHVRPYRYDAIAAEWEGWIAETFRSRYEANKLGVLRRLLHEDDHTAAKVVAREILTDCVNTQITVRDGHFSREKHDALIASMAIDQERIRLEAERALSRCERVIRGEDHTADNYAEHALDPIAEMNHDHDRLRAVVAQFEGVTHVIDVACGSGAFALALARAYPTLQVTAIDFAEGNVAAGRKAAEQLGFAERITWICAPVWDLPHDQISDWWQTFAAEGRRFDGLWCGEFIEHVADCSTLVDAVEAVLVEGARVVYTCPSGPLGEMVPRTFPMHRGHVHHFGQADLLAVFGPKANAALQVIPRPGTTPRGNRSGNWLITYIYAHGRQAGQRPYADRIVTTRPKPTLTVGIIAHNAELDIAKCLDSVWPIADEVIVADCGSTDDTAALAARFDTLHLASRMRVLSLPPVHTLEEGFASARNAVLQAAIGDWFLWIDTDETLLGAPALWKYLESGPYLGYSIAQTHLTIDAPPSSDKPVRLFRIRPDIRFYGCVHEQPQMGDCNGDIQPALEIGDVVIPHTGYLTEAIRRDKMITRNRSLLVRDQERFPDRRLGKVLWIREFANMADMEREQAGGALTAAARRYLQQVVGLFEKHFADPSDKFHALARPFYDRALAEVNGALEVELAIAGRPGGLGKRQAKPSRFWVRSYADLERAVAHRMAEIKKAMHPDPLRVDPFEDAAAPDATVRELEDPSPVA